MSPPKFVKLIGQLLHRDISKLFELTGQVMAVLGHVDRNISSAHPIPVGVPVGFGSQPGLNWIPGWDINPTGLGRAGTRNGRKPSRTKREGAGMKQVGNGREMGKLSPGPGQGRVSLGWVGMNQAGVGGPG